MRRIGGAACAAALLAASAACGTHEVVTRPASVSPVVTGSAAAAGPASGSSSRPAQARVGDTLELAGREPGAVMAVTVTAVADPAEAADGLSAPEAGKRLVAVQFRLHNTGTATYSDSPYNSAALIDEQGQGFNAAITAQTGAGPAFPGSVHVAPGDSALGYIAFEIPADARPARVQFTLDSGFADRTGQWALQGGAPAASTARADGTAPSAAAPSAATATVTATATPGAGSASAAARSPRQVVEEYYAAINARDYPRAWALGGRNLAPDYRTFVAGFAGTATDTLTVTGVRGSAVGIALDALQTDGSHRFFTGTYTVRDGVIVAASVH
ncbi:DUF4352 domain-containing protein [Kitasatospora sp. NBC_01539]|uniref:DUF4352 domain-containing protein n=1 Tax=Kitasatospora sp. NBC_01539 TaxID=2903577 RepID=UPI00386028BD